MYTFLFFISMMADKTMPETDLLTFSFHQLQDSQFVIVNDGVMGGRSSSELNLINDVVNYRGTVSLKNNGGFASVRMIWPFDFNIIKNEPSIAVLKVKGDGQTYQFRLRTNLGFDGAAYSFSFETLKDQVQIIYIPINEFVPTFRGRTLRDMPVLKFSDVQQMGVLVADNQVGDFKIELLQLNLK